MAAIIITFWLQCLFQLVPDSLIILIHMANRTDALLH